MHKTWLYCFTFYKYHCISLQNELLYKEVNSCPVCFKTILCRYQCPLECCKENVHRTFGRLLFKGYFSPESHECFLHYCLRIKVLEFQKSIHYMRLTFLSTERPYSLFHSSFVNVFQCPQIKIYVYMDHFCSYSLCSQ